MFLLSNSDAALVRRTLADQTQAFEELVLRYQRKAHAIARAIGVPGTSVDDVVQEAFLKAFENLPHLRSPASFGPWFLNIVRNAARRCLKELRRRAPVELASGPTPCHTPALEHEEVRARIWAQVAALPEAVREAVFLYYHEGESVRVVAKTLRISRAAVLKRLERGRNLLREKLWRELEDSIRDLLPAAREWRRKGRQLAILVIGVAATAWGIRTAPAAATVSAAGKSGWMFKLLAGGLEMAAKKPVLAIGLALFMMAGGWYLFLSPSGPVERTAGLGPAISTVPPTPRTLAAPVVERPKDSAATVDSDPSQAATPERPPSIFGRVTDAAARGIAGARLRVLPAREWEEIVTRTAAGLADPRDGELTGKIRAAAREFARQAAELAGTETDAGGFYRLDDLGEGEYRVLCVQADHLPRTDGRALVLSGQPFRLDIELAAGWAVTGKVVDESGVPIPGAAVAAARSSDRRIDPRWKKDSIIAGWAEARILLESGRAVTSQEGAFHIGSLDPLPHDFRATKEGYAPARLLEVAAGAGPVAVVLARGLWIRGRVLDPRMQALEGAAVLLVALGPEGLRPAAVNQARDEYVAADHDQEDLQRASSVAGGGFEFTGLAPGLFVLKVEASGFPLRRQEIHLESTSVDMGDLVLAAPRAITGRVLDSRAAPIRGARVWIEEQAPRGVAVHGSFGRSRDLPVLAEARAGADGSFQIDALSDGAYTIHASSRDQAQATLPEVAAGGSPIEIRLPDGATLEGVVLDAVTCLPVANAEVVPGRGSILDPAKRTASGPDGRFTIRGISHDDRKILLEVTHDAYPWQPSEARWDAQHLGRPVEVFLYPAERLEGTVRDGTGNPVAGARITCGIPKWEPVFALRVMGGMPGSVRSGTDGSFVVEVPSLLRGIRFPQDRTAVELVATHPALGIGRSKQFEAPARGQAWPRVEVVLQGTSSLKGQVTDTRGEPVARSVVAAARKTAADDSRALDRGPVLTAFSNDLGAYAISGLETGSYQVETRAQGYPRTLIDPVEIGTEPRLLAVTLDAGTGRAGLVLDDAGLAVTGAEVLAHEGSTVIASAMSDQGGRWRMEGLPDQELTLSALAPGYEASASRVVGAGKTAEPLVLRRLSSLSGVAADSLTGKPVSSFEVFLRIESRTASDNSDTAVELVPREFLDHHGAFRIDDLPPGNSIVLIRAPGFVTWAQKVAMAPGEEATVRALLERGWTLRGAVVEYETGLPIPGARVQCSGGGRRPEDLLASRFMGLAGGTGWTDSSGEFAIPGLVPGEYSVKAQHPGYLPHGDPGRIAGGNAEPQPLRLGMLPAGGLVGKLENLDGKWSIALMLVLTRIDGGSGGDSGCHPEPNGRFQFTSLPAGIYRVELGSYEAQPKPRIVPLGEPLGEIVIRAGETATFVARAP